MRDWRRIWWWPPLEDGARVLDIGAGDGRFSEAAMKRGWYANNLDPSYAPGCWTAEEWAAEHRDDQKYEAIFMWQVIEHLVDPLLVLQAARTVLGYTNGYLVLSTPSTRSIECLLMGRAWDSATREDHRHYFSPTSIRLLLYQAGFSRVTVLHQRVVKHVRGPRWLLLALGCLVAALRISSRITVVARP